MAGADWSVQDLRQTLPPKRQPRSRIRRARASECHGPLLNYDANLCVCELSHTCGYVYVCFTSLVM